MDNDNTEWEAKAIWLIKAVYHNRLQFVVANSQFLTLGNKY